DVGADLTLAQPHQRLGLVVALVGDDLGDPALLLRRVVEVALGFDHGVLDRLAIGGVRGLHVGRDDDLGLEVHGMLGLVGNAIKLPWIAATSGRWVKPISVRSRMGTSAVGAKFFRETR